MRREIVVNAGHGETRAAVLEDRRLAELYIERDEDERVVGNIYKGRVENVLPGMQAAFVNIGLERNAFLYVDDALAHYRNGMGGDDEPAERVKARSIKDVLHEGEEVIVQVTKEPIGTKGARVVTNLTLPGRYLVLMPTVEYVGVSRRIDDEEERTRLKALAKRLRPKGMGLIVRTIAGGKDEEDLVRDGQFLLKVWDRVRRKAGEEKAPALLYKDYDLVYRLVRDAFTPEVTKFVVDSEEEYQKTLELLETLSPNLKDRVYRYHEGPPIFESYQIEPEIEKALDRKVWLQSGGYIVIDQTEALVSIDVNTGRFIGTTNLADTVLRTNLEAASEIARQLRLRNFGGIIVVDFIDMDSREHEQMVLRRLEEELRKDKTKTHVLGFTHLGLVEITRKKTKQNVPDILQKPCPHCDGSGRVLSEATVAHRLERELRKLTHASPAGAFMVEAHPSVAALLIGPGGANLKRLEQDLNRSVYVRGMEHRHVEKPSVVAGSQEEIERQAMPVREGEVVSLKVEEPHISNPKDGIARVEGYVVDIEGAGRRVGQQLQVEITRVFRTYAKARVVSG
ncbi:Rne/Rng family ribonuclease [Limnochorda pilosa]|uniref:Ribonuclease G n=1 Tax=Limnochorda pilosa TaxID=1555112 RepID=A0A0K2SNC2_LIMPI|nr:Rne/Rng family ribonuclease [Limnochorda pilosa]BAS28610.1 ribonuclease G [Limnochorda pilosa]